MEIPKELNNEIFDYCKANSITNIDEFIIKLIKQGFTIEKYGTPPIMGKKPEPQTTKYPKEGEEPIKDNPIEKKKDIYNE